MSTRNQRGHDVGTVGVVLVACLLLMPPTRLDGMFSNLEVALLVFAAAAVLAACGPRVDRVAIPLPVPALLVIMGVSALWSTDRMASSRDLLAVILLAAAAILLVSSSRLQPIVIGIAGAGLLILLWTFVLLVVDPPAALTAQGTAVNGPYGNRNALAFILLQSVPAALAVSVTSARWRWVKYGAVLLLCLGVLLSTSKTALLVLAATLLIAGVVALRRYRRTVTASLLGLGVIGGLIVAFNPVSFLSFLGKDSTINGRLPIWDAVLPLIAQRPLTGYGWSFAWPVASPVSRAVTENLDGVVLFHAHNEVLNWLVTTGALGLLLLIALYALAFGGGWRALSARTRPESASWIGVAAVVLLLRGLSDISETHPEGWFTLMLVAAAAARYGRRDAEQTGSRLVLDLVRLEEDGRLVIGGFRRRVTS